MPITEKNIYGRASETQRHSSDFRAKIHSVSAGIYTAFSGVFTWIETDLHQRKVFGYRMKELLLFALPLIILGYGCTHLKEVNQQAAIKNKYMGHFDPETGRATFPFCTYIYQLEGSKSPLEVEVTTTLNDTALVLSSENPTRQKVVPYNKINKINYAQSTKDVSLSDVWLMGILAWGGRRENFYVFELFPESDGSVETFLIQYPPARSRNIFDDLLVKFSQIPITYPGFD